MGFIPLSEGTGYLGISDRPDISGEAVKNGLPIRALPARGERWFVLEDLSNGNAVASFEKLHTDHAANDAAIIYPIFDQSVCLDLRVGGGNVESRAAVPVL